MRRIFYPPSDVDDDEMSVVLRIDDLRQQLRYATERSVRWSGSLARAMRARAILGSNSIEGYEVAEDEGLAALDGEEPPGTKDETWAAIVGYRNAMTYALQLSDDPHFEFGQGFIRSMHYMMLSYDLRKHPGRWRPGPMYVRNEQKKIIVYEAPPADDVPDLMEWFLRSLERSTMPPLVQAAMAHLNLVMIHPFSDGNGRMARCLQTLILARFGVVERQFCSIEDWLGRNTAEYYDILLRVGQGSWHPENDARPWIRFNLKAHFQQAELLRVRAERTASIWGELEEMVREMSLPERSIYALYDATVGFRIRNAMYRSVVDISEQLASRDLKSMVAAGLLVAIGEARGRSYVSGKRLKDLLLQTRRAFPYVAVDPFTDRESLVQTELF
jgi:Fic family protein